MKCCIKRYYITRYMQFRSFQINSMYTSIQATFFMSVLITACCLAYQAPVGEEHFREHSREGHVFEILMCVRHTPIDSTYAFIDSFYFVWLCALHMIVLKPTSFSNVSVMYPLPTRDWSSMWANPPVSREITRESTSLTHVSFRVLLSHDFSGLPLMESLLVG